MVTSGKGDTYLPLMHGPAENIPSGRTQYRSHELMILDVNNTPFDVSTDPDELLVWVIHEKLGLTKTRFGCGIAMCGACKLLVDGEVVQSCTIKVKDVLGKKIITREVLPEEIFDSQKALP